MALKENSFEGQCLSHSGYKTAYKRTGQKQYQDNPYYNWHASV